MSCRTRALLDQRSRGNASKVKTWPRYAAKCVDGALRNRLHRHLGLAKSGTDREGSRHAIP
eukprot:5715778-Amphidinium_carterae.1